MKRIILRSNYIIIFKVVWKYLHSVNYRHIVEKENFVSSSGRKWISAAGTGEGRRSLKLGFGAAVIQLCYGSAVIQPVPQPRLELVYSHIYRGWPPLGGGDPPPLPRFHAGSGSRDNGNRTSTTSAAVLQTRTVAEKIPSLWSLWSPWSRWPPRRRIRGRWLRWVSHTAVHLEAGVRCYYIKNKYWSLYQIRLVPLRRGPQYSETI